MDPSTWLIIAAVVSAAAGGYSAYSQGQARSQQSELNALIARQNAELAGEQVAINQREKAIQESRHRRETERTLSAQRAGYSKAGVDSAGTPLIAEADTMTEAEIDALAIKYAGTVEQSQIIANVAAQKQEAIRQKMNARQYRTAGTIGVGESLLTGATRVAAY